MLVASLCMCILLLFCILFIILPRCFFFFFFFNDTATTEIYTLSLHDALPICCCSGRPSPQGPSTSRRGCSRTYSRTSRSEEHTSELQSRSDLVCRLLLEKKKKTHTKLDSNQTKTIAQHRDTVLR